MQNPKICIIIDLSERARGKTPFISPYVKGVGNLITTSFSSD
nr:MAG TPA: hypothetical protein [Caudoviricetes sp.]